MTPGKSVTSVDLCHSLRRLFRLAAFLPLAGIVLSGLICRASRCLNGSIICRHVNHASGAIEPTQSGTLASDTQVVQEVGVACSLGLTTRAPANIVGVAATHEAHIRAPEIIAVRNLSAALSATPILDSVDSGDTHRFCVTGKHTPLPIQPLSVRVPGISPESRPLLDEPAVSPLCPLLLVKHFTVGQRAANIVYTRLCNGRRS